MQGKAELTPAGIQSRAELRRRRFGVLLACLGLYASLLLWLCFLLAGNGFEAVRVGLVICLAVAAPWTVLGAVNAGLGFWLLRRPGDLLRRAAPFALAGSAGRLRTRAAVLMTIRNEDSARAFARLRAVAASLDAQPDAAAFDFFILSDSDDPAIAAAERLEFAHWLSCARAPGRIHYRRRTENAGFKAGNIADFCARWGAGYEFMIPLDADSLMDGATIVKLVRIGEAWPRLGLIQTLVVGAPSRSAFARIFQFGMRAGMRAYTVGATWWAGDCAPFWGHNALVRVAPFARHCRLPLLKGGAAILSHDQIEAALMRRAGYETRMLPLESGSYEDNPPTLVDFVRREARWRRGNMQYVELLRLPGLAPMSRFHLLWAIGMYLRAPALAAALLLAALMVSRGGADGLSVPAAAGFVSIFLFLNLLPKLAGYLDTALTPGAVARQGGRLRFAASVGVESLASLVIGAATGFDVAVRMIAAPLLGRVEWGAQARDAHGVTVAAALRLFAPQLAFCGLLFGLTAAGSWRLALWTLPLTAAYALAPLFAVASASPRVGRLFVTARLCASAEESASPAVLRALSPPEEAAPAGALAPYLRR